MNHDKHVKHIQLRAHFKDITRIKDKGFNKMKYNNTEKPWA